MKVRKTVCHTSPALYDISPIINSNCRTQPTRAQSLGQDIPTATGSDALLQWLLRHAWHRLAVADRALHRGSFFLVHGYSNISGLHQLTRLELKNMTERPKLLSAVGNCVKDLVHLSLDNVYFDTQDADPAVKSTLSEKACKLLAGCSRLSYLQVTRCNIDDAFVAAISRGLPQFKLLDLSSSTYKVDVSTAHSNSGSNVSVRSGSSGDCLLKLQALHAGGMKLTRPEVMGALTRLTSLHLKGVTVSDPGSLVLALPQLLQLWDLDMRCWQEQRFNLAGLRDALMPLTQLTALGLSGTTYVYDHAALELQLIAQQWSGHGRWPAVGGSIPGLHLPRLEVLDANELYWTDSRRCIQTAVRHRGPA